MGGGYMRNPAKAVMIHNAQRAKRHRARAWLVPNRGGRSESTPTCDVTLGCFPIHRPSLEEREIVLNLEHIITAKEVLMINSTNPLVVQFVHHHLRDRIHDSNVRPPSTPHKTQTLEEEAYPALDELTSRVSTLNLERVRQIKSRLVAISGRVQKARDELEHLLDDDNDMAEMYLTEKLNQSMDQSSLGGESDGEDHDESDARWRPTQN